MRRSYLDRTRDQVVLGQAREFLAELDVLSRKYGLTVASAENLGRLAVIPISAEALNGVRGAVVMDWKRR